MAARGVCVISGLAHGIDAAAHQGAIDRAKPTVGILGGGHRHFFPKRNVGLAELMLANGGAVLSPYAPNEPARPGQFLQRNAVVASLAEVVVVVEAAERSGALNTAGWAIDLGITVLAFPGDVDRPVSAGCNKLIRDGATLARGPDDVFEALGSLSGPPLPTIESAIRERYLGEPNVLAVLRVLGTEPRSLDTIARATGFTAGETMALLIRLEIEGAIERRDLMEYVLVQ
jgi:DNA processing protein